MRSPWLLACAVACSGCVNTAYPRLRGAALAEERALARPPSDEYVVGPAPDAASARYEAERLEIRENVHNPDRFEVCTRWACITENELVRRYRKQTGAHDLDDFERDRWASVRWFGAAVFGGLGAISTTVGAIKIAGAEEEHTPKKRSDAQIGGGIALGAGVAILVMGTSFLLAPSDGVPVDHYLTKVQTRRFVERYNRALRERGPS